ncbi:hypothetical protein [Chitinimonas koreensis]|uniref:hypothetical protein n=1 Tax=Chitinimonas koreensis TaxID=356302 RepID=UPI000407FBFB|nr:hypothetical protein [Chitinimonas koreensis]QNM96014.1 hypothetical protein H9L41_19680 [Chitinimonas koreensis]
MSTLAFGPDAPFLAHLAADALLWLHIAGGTVGIAAGTLVLLLPKGGRLHRLCGRVFFASMSVAFAIGAGVAPFLDDGQRPNFVAGLFSLYLVVSGWLTLRRRRRGTGPLDLLGLAIAAATAIAGAMLVQLAKASPTGTVDGAPVQSFYLFLVLGTVASLDDLGAIVRKGYTGAARIARHLWRMCAALFFASGSLFLGQPQVFPAYLRESAWLFLPVVLPLLCMLSWLLRLAWKSWRMRSATVQSRALV